VAVYVKRNSTSNVGPAYGGNWVGPIANGNIRSRWGGGWFVPSYVRSKRGNVGAGSWHDSGYRGLPTAPTNLAVNSWTTYESVSFKWNAGAGGAPAASYDVQINNQANNAVVASSNDTASPSISFTQVVPYTKYNVYVRAKTASGQVSDWVGPLKIWMGKAAVTTYTTETATRAWSNGQGINSYKDVSDGCIVPSSVKLTHVRFVIYANEHFTGILCPYNNRQIYAIHNGGLGGQFNWQAWSIDETHYWDYNGNGGLTGLRCAGTGWSIYSTGLQRALGNVYAYGNETYSYQQAHTTPAVANTYW